MRVLHVHNFYQLPGGEDQCFASTGAMLKEHGHEVVPFTLDNDAVATLGKAATATTASTDAAIASAATTRGLRILRERLGFELPAATATRRSPVSGGPSTKAIDPVIRSRETRRPSRNVPRVLPASSRYQEPSECVIRACSRETVGFSVVSSASASSSWNALQDRPIGEAQQPRETRRAGAHSRRACTRTCIAARGRAQRARGFPCSSCAANACAGDRTSCG